MGMDMGWVRASRSLTRSDKSGGGRHWRTMNGQMEAWKGGTEREERKQEAGERYQATHGRDRVTSSSPGCRCAQWMGKCNVWPLGCD